MMAVLCIPLCDRVASEYNPPKTCGLVRFFCAH